MFYRRFFRVKIFDYLGAFGFVQTTIPVCWIHPHSLGGNHNTSSALRIFASSVACLWYRRTPLGVGSRRDALSRCGYQGSFRFDVGL